jgi:hypothetical protein
LGGVLGHSLCTGAAVLGGKVLSEKISKKAVLFIGAGEQPALHLSCPFVVIASSLHSASSNPLNLSRLFTLKIQRHCSMLAPPSCAADNQPQALSSCSV